MSEATTAAGTLSRTGLSVRARIVLSILLVTGLGLAVAGLSSYLVARAHVLAQIDDELDGRLDDVRLVASGQAADDPSAAPVTYASTRELVRAVVQRLVPAPRTGTLGLVAGRPAYAPQVTGVELSRDTDFVSRVEAAVAGAGPGGGAVVGTADTSLGQLRYLGVRLQATGDPQTGTFILGYDVAEELGEITDAFRTYTVAAVLVLIAVGAVAWFVAGRLLRPIRTLRETAARISATDLSERIPVRGRDDVSALTGTVNDMLDRLEDSVDRQRAMLDDVGHELKTPLTVVLGHLELLDPADPDDVAATRTLAIEELDRMSGLVQDISVLAAVQRPEGLHRTPVDVADLTEQVTRKASALSTGHRWRAEVETDAVASLDVERITQAWLALAANAARYSPTGTTIRLGARTRGDRLLLTVADEGPGVPADSRERIFTRFERGSTAADRPGSGLGLAIVSAIAAEHGGSARVEPRSPTGSLFVIDLPEPVATTEIPEDSSWSTS